ncbi:MAG: hypothetical protein RBS80_27475, partial [Thermoguttaceae bacterium]|nr:hypothetical protein [Thermoguttaceae bacterium]
YLGKGELKEANRRSKESAGRWIDPEYVERLPDDLRYPIFFTLPWERHGWVRCQVGTATVANGEDYVPVWLDVPQSMYENLGEVEVPAGDPLPL